MFVRPDASCLVACPSTVSPQPTAKVTVPDALPLTQEHVEAHAKATTAPKPSPTYNSAAACQDVYDIKDDDDGLAFLEKKEKLEAHVDLMKSCIARTKANQVRSQEELGKKHAPVDDLPFTFDELIAAATDMETTLDTLKVKVSRSKSSQDLQPNLDLTYVCHMDS